MDGRGRPSLHSATTSPVSPAVSVTPPTGSASCNSESWILPAKARPLEQPQSLGLLLLRISLGGLGLRRTLA